MKNKILLALSVVGLIFLLLFAINIFSYRSYDTEKQSKQPDSVTVENNDSTYTSLENFTNISMNVLASDVSVVTGTEFSIQYNLRSKEGIQQEEVVDGTFYFIVDPNWDAKQKQTDHKVIITVPKDTALGTVSISSISGSITISNLQISQGTFDTTSGNIDLSHVTAAQSSAKTVSGKITTSESTIKTFDAKNTSGAISGNGYFEQVQMKSISGNCRLSGSLANSATIQTTSGNIKVSAPVSSIHAETKRNIKIGEDVYSHSYYMNDGQPEVTLESVSGTIHVQKK